MQPIAWRQKVGLTQKELAEKLGVGVRSLIRYEFGDREWPAAALVKLNKLSRGAVAYEDVLEARKPRRRARRAA